jgi:Ty3 transposon capsid-like protein/Zinc knuckle
MMQAEEFQRFVQEMQDGMRSLQARNSALEQQVQQFQQQQQAAAAAQPQPPIQTAIIPVSTSQNAPKPPKPDTYDGNMRTNVETWLFQLSQYFTVARVADAERVPFAVTFLRENALTWWRSDSMRREQQHESPITTWKEFESVFRTRFQPVDQSNQARLRLTRLQQERSVAAYNGVFLRELQMINDMSVADQILHYTNGLKREVAKEVALKDPKSVDEAMIMAQRYEMITSNRRFQLPSNRPSSSSQYRPNSYAPHSTSAPMDLSNMEDVHGDYDMPNEHAGQFDATAAASEFNALQRKPFQQQSSNTNNNSNNNNKRRQNVPGLSKEAYDQCMRSGQCFRCKRTGHLARNCPTNSKAQRT